MLLDRILAFFTSLRLTVVCLGCALVLVFAGTLAQVHLGLYVTQERYFRSLFVMWGPEGSHWRIPIWPGGYLLGGLLLVNLIAAHIKRFSFSRKKIGLFFIHAGLILLLVGQFLTEMFQVESFMRLEEGQTKNYSESSRKSELAIVEVSSAQSDRVVTIPESWLTANKEIRHPDLPVTIRVKEYFLNSGPAPALKSVAGNAHTIEATQGVGQRLRFQPRDPTTRMDMDNIPAALIEVSSSQGVLGTWTVSNWFTKYPGALREMLGAQLGSLVDTPQEFTYAGKTYRLALRPVRYYKPYQITLLEFTHKRYKGTEIPKDFSSRVRLQNPATGEDREIRIFMNNPLRYAGETYYQASFEPGDTVSILQVVRNPAWLTPYFSCTLVGLGLIVQFLMHLIGFGRKTTQKAAAPAAAGARSNRKGTDGTESEAVAVGSAEVKAFQTVKRRNA